MSTRFASPEKPKAATKTRGLRRSGAKSYPHESAKSHNFHVAELQNYSVGCSGVLVHNTNDPIRDPYPTLQDAMGETEPLPKGAIVGRVPTKNPGIAAQDYTETIYVIGSDGKQYTVFYNPKTGQYAGKHPSSE